jgi:hypothetical protein
MTDKIKPQVEPNPIIEGGQGPLTPPVRTAVEKPKEKAK